MMPTADDYVQLLDGKWVLKESARKVTPPAVSRPGQIESPHADMTGIPPEPPPPKPSIALPDNIWRGLFAEYRDLVSGTTEAPDIYHFGIFAFVLGVTLARRIWLNYARPIYPNFYICEVGTSALTRKGTA